MTSWRSSSNSGHVGRAGGIAALALAVVVALSCRVSRSLPRLPAGAAEQPVFALFAVQNASGGAAPVRALGEALEVALAARGLQVIPRANLAEVMARNRIRYEGGLDSATARLLRAELGAV